MIAAHGTATYAILWGIVFCETGLVLTPFLPGDSLLFAAGAFAGMGQLSLGVLCAVFLSSAVLGDAVNYAIGNKLGRWALERRLLDPGHIARTEAFYAKYGGKTVVLARFVPIVRTFAPFVAGIGSMAYARFAAYNVGGAVLWTALFVGAGFFFGNMPVVQHNFTLVVLGIVAVSVLPVAWELWQARREAAAGGGGTAHGGSAA
ncbi:dedA [Scenedesmus sp. PABB004]|nr:dedA [Scenedesmus sp. PABB004]